MKIPVSIPSLDHPARFRRGILLTASFSIGLWIAQPSLAQRPDGNLSPGSQSATGIAKAVEEPADAGRPTTPSNFGTVDGIELWIPASQFTPLVPSSGQLAYLSSYYYGASPGGRYVAHLPLPQGARITGYRTFYFDNDATLNLGFGLQKVYDDITANPTSDFDVISSFGSTVQSVNNQSAFVNFVHTVDLREPLSGTTHGPGEAADFYTAFVDMPNSTDVRFKGVRFFWFRQVSPAPATATFSDVPVGHPQHRFVEALAAAGITAGCDPGNYCPSAPVTRGQMAVFLSVALGLHWPPF